MVSKKCLVRLNLQSKNNPKNKRHKICIFGVVVLKLKIEMGDLMLVNYVGGKFGMSMKKFFTKRFYKNHYRS